MSETTPFDFEAQERLDGSLAEVFFLIQVKKHPH